MSAELVSGPGTDAARLARAFAELAHTLAADLDVDEFLYRLCEQAQQVLSAQAVGVLVEDEHGRLRLSGASSEAAEKLDLFELQAHEGPCYEAYVGGQPVAAPDLRETRDRWPGFTPRAEAAGYHAVFGFPLRLGDDCVGAMNIFRAQPGSLDEIDVVLAEAFTDLATVGLFTHRRLTNAELRAAQLQQALDSRVRIEQAKGVVAARRDITPDEAFDLIRAFARRHRMTLRDVCRRIVRDELDIDA